MTKNMSSADRIIRIILAAVAGYAYYTGMIEGWLGLALVALAIVFVITSIFGFCPLYTLFGFRTCKAEA